MSGLPPTPIETLASRIDGLVIAIRQLSGEMSFLGAVVQNLELAEKESRSRIAELLNRVELVLEESETRSSSAESDTEPETTDVPLAAAPARGREPGPAAGPTSSTSVRSERGCSNKRPPSSPPASEEGT